MKYARKKDIAEHYEVSTRTVERWMTDPTFPDPCADGRRYLFEKVVAWFDRPRKVSRRSLRG